jgi:hypothetical protein
MRQSYQTTCGSGARCNRANSSDSASSAVRSSRVRQRRVLTSPPGHEVLVARGAAAVGEVQVGEP